MHFFINMNKNEKVFSSKDLKIKKDKNKSKIYTKINKNLLHHEKFTKEINKSLSNKCYNTFSNKEKMKSQKQLNSNDKLFKK